MARAARVPLQELIRRRRRAAFVGRSAEPDAFRRNLDLVPEDDRHRFVFHVHGPAGVGKTSLVREREALAAGRGALTAVVDDRVIGVPETMAAISARLAAQGAELKGLDRLLGVPAPSARGGGGVRGPRGRGAGRGGAAVGGQPGGVAAGTDRAGHGAVRRRVRRGAGRRREGPRGWWALERRAEPRERAGLTEEAAEDRALARDRRGARSRAHRSDGVLAGTGE